MSPNFMPTLETFFVSQILFATTVSGFFFVVSTDLSVECDLTLWYNTDMFKSHQHAINYARILVRDINYRPSFNGTALAYLDWRLTRHNRTTIHKIHLLGLELTEEDFDILRNKHLTKLLFYFNGNPSMSDLMEKKEEIRDDKA